MNRNAPGQHPQHQHPHGPSSRPPISDDDAAVNEVLSEIGQQPAPMANNAHQAPHPQPQPQPQMQPPPQQAPYVMTPEMQQQLQHQQMLQEQIEYQQQLLNQREAEMDMRQNEMDAALIQEAEANKPSETSVLGMVSNGVSGLVGSVFNLNIRLIAVGASLFLIFQYVNITIVLNAIMRAFRMREFTYSPMDNGMVVQVARAVVFGSLVSIMNALVKDDHN